MKHYSATEIDTKVRAELGDGWGGVKISRYYVIINRDLGVSGQDTQATTLEAAIVKARATQDDATTRPAPSAAADWYAVNYPGCSPARIAAEHGGPETQKGGAHAPVAIRNPTGQGMATVTGCACGFVPPKFTDDPRSTARSYQAHVKREGLPRISNFSHTVYPAGHPAEGLTFNEWYAWNGAK